MAVPITISGGSPALSLAASGVDSSQIVPLSNTGGGNLYYGDDASVSPTNYVGVIGLAGTLTRNPGVPTYVATDIGATFTFSYINDGSSVTPGTVTIPGTVNITAAEPVEVIPQNAVIEIVNKPGALIGAGATVTLASLTQTQLVGYSSVVIKGTPNSGAGVGTNIPVLRLIWLDQSGNVLDNVDYQFDAVGSFEINTPIKGAALNVNVYNSNGPAFTLQQIIVALATPLLVEQYKHSYNPVNNQVPNSVAPTVTGMTLTGYYNDVHNNVFYADFTLTAATGNIYCDSKGGRCHVGGYVITAGGAIVIYENTQGGVNTNNPAIFYGAIGAVPDNMDADITLPNGPILATVSGAVGTRVRFTLTYG